MGARFGWEYIEGLRDDREVWLGGERITDVTAHAAFAGSVAGMAGFFDWQHRFADDCLMPNPNSGEPMGVSHLIPRSRDDLDRRHHCFNRLAQYSMGMLGRTPDYVNVTFAGFAGRADVISQNGNEEGGENLVRYQRMIAQRDLSLTHAIVHPVVDKALSDVDGVNGEIALRKVGETANGIIVRGARILATLGPFADEVAVYPGHPIDRDARDYALAFSIPAATPGLRMLCRDHYQAGDSAFDRPFSSRFDEQDAFLIFDDVEVPRDRIFINGSTDVYNRLMTAGWVANVMQQTSIRARVKLEFAYDLCAQMARALNDDRDETQRLLGEVWSYAELTRAAIRGAEAGAREYGAGTWFCDDRPFHALRPTMPGWMTRVTDIIKTIGGHNLLATPSRADLRNETLGPLVNTYMPGANDMSAAERSALFRLAWDFAGSALGSRTELYERYYLASAPRMYRTAHTLAQRQHEWTAVRDFLSETKDEA